MNAAELAETIRARRFAEALERMLEVWRKNRSGELGELIERLSAQVRREPIPGRGDSTLEAIREYQRSGDACDLPRILECVRFGMRRKRAETLIGEMREWRLGRAMLAMVESPPQAHRHPRYANAFWLGVFSLARRNADSAQVARMAELLDHHRSAPPIRLTPLFLDQLARVPSVERRTDLEPSPTADQLAEIRRAIEAIEPSPRLVRDVEAMFDAVYADPDDDGRRGLLADALYEIGDPRGEFIALQLLDPAKRSSEQIDRETKLLDAFSRRWLGRLEPAIVDYDLEFERGFPAKMIVDIADSEIESFIGLREWRTAVQIDLRKSREQRRIAQGLERLRSIRGANASFLRGVPYPFIRELEMREWDARLALKLRTGDFPALRRLWINPSFYPLKPATLRGLWAEGRIGPNLEVIIQREPINWDLRVWLDFIRQGIDLKRLVVVRTKSGCRVTAERGPDGRVVVTDIQSRTKDWKFLRGAHAVDLSEVKSIRIEGIKNVPAALLASLLDAGASADAISHVEEPRLLRSMFDVAERPTTTGDEQSS